MNTRKFAARRMVETLESRLLMATISVLNTNDSGAGSLRDAITAAVDGDTISLASLSGTIVLTSGELALSKDLTIAGPGANPLSIDGAGTSRIFAASSGKTISISDLTLTNGNASLGGAINSQADLTLDRVNVIANTATSAGGGIYMNAGTMTLNDCSISSNTVEGTGGADGGGIYSIGSTLTMNRCTIDHNSVTGASGSNPGRGYGGGLYLGTSGTRVFTNCTFSNNVATGGDGTSFMMTGTAVGGAIINNSTGSLTILNCTITGNSANGGGGTQAGQGYGGGLYFYNSPSGTLTNTIIAGNTATTNVQDFDNYYITSGGNNLIGISEGGPSLADGVNGDMVGTTGTPIDANLGALADNGGFTKTHELLTGSVAINAGKSSGAPATDQRGRARGASVDIGAFEVVANAAPIFSSTQITAATAGQAYNYTITATDDDGDDVVITAPTKPTWLTFTDNGDGTATLSGTPTNSNAGANSVELNVADASLSNSQSFDITVTAVSPPSPPPPPPATDVLTVTGSSDVDDIHVWIRPDNTIRVVRNSKIKNFSRTGIARIDIDGLEGNDTIVVNTRDITVYALGGSGNDTIMGGDEYDILTGGSGNDSLDGGGGDDRLNGSSGIDVLVGSGGHDRFFGGDGNDTFIAHDGISDTLVGGAGNDSADSDASDTRSEIEFILG